MWGRQPPAQHNFGHEHTCTVGVLGRRLQIARGQNPQQVRSEEHDRTRQRLPPGARWEKAGESGGGGQQGGCSH
ncbi:unnamed protein product [Symbiodinium sp. CCMP2592]|nr:unnamed protein product [Symbiodinium sp. CCMP2592]